ncbi:cell surface glycoprotein 1 [Fusarium langsethiae]|uniref:Cell surface glycoprotein 1 n=1 Tax=Fusarium langsethiae TaxID=179993 RepID=A0A0M9ERP4_FUSLA|nr:cell surface glycoprotein 1 [Fusarium langsethiae]
MRLLKGLVIGLLIKRGLGQTDSQPAGDDAVATVAEPPTETGGADVPVPEPSAPSGGGGGNGGGDEERPPDPIPEPEPSSGDGARVPADESAPVEPPTESSDVTEPSGDEQPGVTGDPGATDGDTEPSPTDAEPTDAGAEQSPTDAPEPTDTNGEEPMATNSEPDIIPSDALNSAPEEAIPGPTETGQDGPVSTPEASDPRPALLPTVTPSDSMTETPDEPTANSGSEDQPSNTRAELIGPTLTGDDSGPTATDAEATSAASDGADNGGDSDQGTDSPVASHTTPLETEGDKDKLDSPTETGGNVASATGGSDPSAAGGGGDSPETTDLPDDPQETKEADSDPDTISTESSDKPPKASAPAATGKDGFTTVTGSKPAPTEAYEVPVDLKDDTVLGDYAEFKEASDGGQDVLLKPPANGKANCEIAPTGGEVDKIPAGEYIRVLLSVKVEKVGASNTKDGKTGSRLKMLVDENTVYDKELVSTGDSNGSQDIESDPFESAKNQKIRMIQECGEEPVELTIQDANIRVARSDKTGGGGGGKSDGGSGSGSGSGGDSGNDSGSGSGSNSGSGSGSGDKGSGGGDGGSDSDAGSGSGSGSDSGSGSGTGGAASPSATSVGEGQTNIAGKTQTVRELLMYALPLLAAFMG